MIRSDIQKKLDDVKDIKLNMRNAIHSRSVDIDADTLFKDYPQKIDEIPDPNYLYAISGNWSGELDTMYFNPDVHYIPAYTGVEMGVESVVLHAMVSNIGSTAIALMPNLKNIISYAVYPPVLADAQVFFGNPSSVIFKVPVESLDTYRSAQHWSAFASQMEGF